MNPQPIQGEPSVVNPQQCCATEQPQQYAPPQQSAPPQQYAQSQQSAPPQQYAQSQQYAPPQQYAQSQQYALQQQYPPCQQYSQPGVIAQQPHFGGASGATCYYSRYPAFITCQFCHCPVKTTVHYKIGLFTWLLAALVALCGCVCGCCLIPFCIGGVKDVEHSCPNCKNVVGIFSQFG